MNYRWTKLPLFDSWDYRYSTTIENTLLNLRFIYNDRTQTWNVSIYDSEMDALVEGVRIVPLSPVLDSKVRELSGFFWMEPVSLVDDNEVKKHPDRIDKYYNLYYISTQEE